MHIAYVITRGDDLGGAGIHLFDLVQGVRAAGANVTVFLGSQGLLSDRLLEAGIPVIPLKRLRREIHPFDDVAAYYELRKFLLELKPDVVHLHSSKAGVIGRLAAKSLGIPAVFTAHGWAFTEGVDTRKRYAYAHIERWMSKFTDHIIAVSDYDRSLALRLNVCAPNAITTIHNGVPDSHRDTFQSRRGHGSLISLLMVARFDPPKDQMSLVRALSKVKATNWILHLLGDGTLKDEALKQVAKLGLQDRVKFHGNRANVPDYLANADIFVLVSDWEGLPLSILEAMCAGLPVIASDVGGVSEAVEDGQTGYLVPRGDESSLRTTIERLLGDACLRTAMGFAGRMRYEMCFSHESMLNSTMTIYKRVYGKS